MVLKEEALETVDPQPLLFLVLGLGVGGGEVGGQVCGPGAGGPAHPAPPHAHLEQVPVLGNGQIGHLEPQGVPRTLAHAQVAALGEGAERAASSEPWPSHVPLVCSRVPTPTKLAL